MIKCYFLNDIFISDVICVRQYCNVISVRWQARGLLDWEASAMKSLKDLRPLGAVSHTTQGEKSHAYHTPSIPMYVNLQLTMIPASSVVP